MGNKKMYIRRYKACRGVGAINSKILQNEGYLCHQGDLLKMAKNCECDDLPKLQKISSIPSGKLAIATPTR